MAKGYWVVRVDIDDLEQYKKYIAANASPLNKFGAKFLVRGGQGHVPEGPPANRLVIIEFDSCQIALDCYHSPEYQAALKLRRLYSKAHFAIVEGA